MQLSAESRGSFDDKMGQERIRQPRRSLPRRVAGDRNGGPNPFVRSVDAIARSCIAVRLRLLNRVVTNLYDDALRPLGLKVSQLNLLVVTAKLGLARPA